MSKEFYPMMTRTIKNLVELAQVKDARLILYILVKYPDVSLLKKEELESPLVKTILIELDRQFSRWTKGYQNGNI